MKYAWIDLHPKNFELAKMCVLRKANINGYRAWKRYDQPDCKRLVEVQIGTPIRAIHFKPEGAYSSPGWSRELRIGVYRPLKRAWSG